MAERKWSKPRCRVCNGFAADLIHTRPAECPGIKAGRGCLDPDAHHPFEVRP